MSQPAAIIVIQAAVNKRLFIALLSGMFTIQAGTIYSASQPNAARAEGTVTYVTSLSFYTDLGRNQGLSKGDSLTVFSDGQMILKAEVTNLSNKSSVCSLPSGNIVNVGDMVIWEGFIPVPEPDSVYVNESESKSAVAGKLFEHLKGSVSMRLDEDAVANGDTSEKMYLLVNLRLQSILNTPFSVSVFGRTHLSGDQNTNGFTLHQIQIQYHDRRGRWDIDGGRIYNFGISGAGAVDGLNIRRQFQYFQLGALGGWIPAGNGISGTKAGLYLNLAHSLSIVSVMNLAFISEVNNYLNRQYAYFIATLKPHPIVSIMTDGTLDLSHSAAGGSGLTMLNLNADLQPWPWLQAGLGYNQSRDLNLTPFGISTLDTTFVPLTRQSISGRIAVKLSRNYRISSRASLLFLENQSGSLKNFMLRLQKRRFLTDEMDLHTSVNILMGDLYHSNRVRFGIDSPWKDWEISAGGSLYWYWYGTGGENKFRQTLEIDLSRPLSGNFYTLIYGELSHSSDENQFYISAQLTYRFQ